MQIGELKVRLGVDSDTFKVKDFIHELGQIPFTVAAGITALTGMSFALTDMLRDTLGLANNLSVFRAETGLSATELEKWTGVAKQMGLNADAVQSSVMNIGKAFATLKAGGNADAFLVAAGRLGVKQGSPFEMLRQAITNAAGMKDRFLGAKLLSDMGIDQSLLKIGQLSSSEFSSMAKKGVILDDKGIKAMQDFQIAMSSFEIELAKSFTPALVAATPIMGKLADSLAELIKTIGPMLIKGTVAAVGNVASIVDIVKHAKDLKPVVEGFVAGIGYRAPHEMDRKSIVNITNNIHSTADANAVADIVNEFTANYHKKAMKHFNNGGR